MQFILKLLFIYSVLFHGTPSHANTEAITAKQQPEVKLNPTQKSAESKINLNLADVNSLQTLKGIGPKRAQAIVDHRSKNGAFSSLDDLAKVKGLNSNFVAQLLKDNPDKISLQ